MKKLFLASICFVCSMATVYSQCESNDLIYLSNTIQEGIYKTNATIESAGSINNQAKFMATDRITLKSGFSVEIGETFEAINSGCNYLQEYVIESIIDPYPCLKMNTPDTYTAGEIMHIGGDEGGWYTHISNILGNSDVHFYASEEGGSPYIPATLSEPLPAIHEHYNHIFNEREMIYSASENGKINGVLYYKMVTDQAWEREAFYLHLSANNNYNETLYIEYASAKHDEVISILETVSTCIEYAFAEISWQGTTPIDSCSYSITIGYDEFAAVNPEMIETLFSTNPPNLVFIGYESSTHAFSQCGSFKSPMLIKSITDLSTCTAQNYNASFTAKENILYCFPDGQSFFIKNIANRYCPYCVVDCFTHGELVLDLEVVDSSGNNFSYVHPSVNDAALPNGWTISVASTGSESGCDYITEFEMTVNNPNTTFEEDFAALQQMLADIEAIAESEPCVNSADWAFTAIGSKACGGPQFYIAYSNNIDVPSFLNSVAAYTQAEQEYNIKWGIISTCDLALMPNGISCVNGEPVFN